MAWTVLNEDGKDCVSLLLD